MVELKYKFFLFVTCILFAFKEIKCGVYSSFKPSYPFVAVLNCSVENPNIFYDLSKQKWTIQRYSTCSTTEKDILSLCERVYPQFYIKSVSQYRHKTKYFLNECKNITKANNFETQNMCQYKIEYAYPFKCIYEISKSNEDDSESYEMPLSEIETTSLENLSKTSEAYFVPVKFKEDLKIANNNNNQGIIKQEVEVSKSGKIILNIVIVLVLIVSVVVLSKKIKKFFHRNKTNEYDFNLNNPALQDEHINNMQVNGYENPAYKLYEQNVVT